MLELTRFVGDRMLRLLMVAGVGLMLGACTKCDVPNLLPASTPHACHSDAPAG